MSICKPHIHLWTVNMHFIVLLCIFTRILAHRSDIFDDWENAQVFIYKRRIGLPLPHFDISETYPSCFSQVCKSFRYPWSSFSNIEREADARLDAREARVYPIKSKMFWMLTKQI